MTGYTRQSAASIVTDAVIEDFHFNNEFNQLEAAFSSSTGHAHDGTTGSGPQINLTTSVTGVLPITNGGTGANTVAGAQSALSINPTATTNQTDAFLLARANHTGTQDVSTIAGLSGVLASYVVGPASTANNSIAAFDGTTGKLIKNSGYSAAGILSRANHTGTQAISTVASLQTSLDAKVAGPASAVASRIAIFSGTTGKIIADGGQTVATVLARANHTGTQAISTVSGLQTALDSLANSSNPWASQPIGAPIPIFDNLTGVSAPPTNESYRYVKLTAGDAYNSGVLTSESVSGSAPSISATATISLSDSPLNGQSIRLINTERRFLRAGSAGVLEESQNLSHNHSASTNSAGSHAHTASTNSTGGHTHSGSTNATGAHTHTVPVGNGGGGGSAYGDRSNQSSSGNALTSGSAGSHSHTLTINSAGAHSHTVTVNSGGDHSHTVTVNSDGGTEARPRNIGVTYYMRIR